MALSISETLIISFDRGSLVISAGSGLSSGDNPLPYLSWDGRIGAFRSLAIHYRAIVRHLTQTGVKFKDEARRYPELNFEKLDAPRPFHYQEEALQAWQKGKRGMVELPTGSGKTRLALMAINLVKRGTLIIVPTLELVTQWSRVLEDEFRIIPGAIGGGSYQIEPITVSTYASAYRHGEKFGNRFGFVIFDECHHLSGVGYSHIADVLIAPYRLGLSATIERPDQKHLILNRLIGPVVFKKSINELSGKYLADYSVKTRYAELTVAERQTYLESRETYLAYARERGLTLASASDWQRFIFAASQSREGREAISAYYRQKNIAFAAEGKFQICAELLDTHRETRVLIFTNDNATAHQVSRRFLLPLITHQTGLAERREIMTNFHQGRWPALVTSKVLNEGVDVPSAAVAIILSGNASVREHVQRLGRILRKDGRKQAVLYEVLTRQTVEEKTSQRRREHDAYR